MEMKKILKNIAIGGLTACVCIASFGGAKADTADLFADATVAYNEVYSFKAKDENGQKLSYTVKNSAGEDVPVYNYTFAVTENAPYTVTVSYGKKSKSYTLTPKDMSAPEIRVKRNVERINVLNGEKANYPEISVWDNADKEVEVSYAVSFNGANYESDGEGFTPTELGYYELTVSAKDDAGNVATKKVVYESVATVEETYKMFAFDEEGSIRYFDYLGMSRYTYEYNTDAKYVYGNEKGSTRLKVIVEGTPMFCLKNQMVDALEFDYIRFYVYNAHTEAIGLGANVTSRMYHLQPGVWTEVIIDTWSSAFTPDMNHSDITGMCFMFFGSGTYNERFGYSADLYFSAAYGVNI